IEKRASSISGLLRVLVLRVPLQLALPELLLVLRVLMVLLPWAVPLWELLLLVAVLLYHPVQIYSPSLRATFVAFQGRSLSFRGSWAWYRLRPCRDLQGRRSYRQLLGGCCPADAFAPFDRRIPFRGSCPYWACCPLQERSLAAFLAQRPPKGREGWSGAGRAS
ncbi:hypothetical protein PMAYCL1PPCAC_16073, partial [Pristionchus mayeri]